MVGCVVVVFPMKQNSARPVQLPELSSRDSTLLVFECMAEMFAPLCNDVITKPGATGVLTFRLKKRVESDTVTGRVVMKVVSV